jgi:hypothetical protein
MLTSAQPKRPGERNPRGSINLSHSREPLEEIEDTTNTVPVGEHREAGGDTARLSLRVEESHRTAEGFLSE